MQENIPDRARNGYSADFFDDEDKSRIDGRDNIGYGYEDEEIKLDI